MLELAYPLVLLALPLPLIVYRVLPKAVVQQSALKVPFYNTLQALGGAQKMASGRSRIQKILAVLVGLRW